MPSPATFSAASALTTVLLSKTGTADGNAKVTASATLKKAFDSDFLLYINTSLKISYLIALIG